MPKPLIMFDCDGVLVDTEGRANEHMAKVFTAIGVPMTGPECRTRFQGMAVGDVCRKIHELSGVLLDGEELRAEVLAQLTTGIQPIDGVEDLVETLIAKDYPVCVASSGKLVKMRTTLGQTRMLPWLENVLFSSDSVGRGKPDPAIYRYAAMKMGFSCENAVVIEDSTAGVRAGVAAGARVLGYCGDPFVDCSTLTALGAEALHSMSDALALIEAHQDRASAST